MKKRNNGQLKIIAATSMSIFSLAAVFIATAAWFTVSRKVDSNGDGFEVTAYDGLIENISLYKQSSYSSSDNTYTYSYEKNSIVDIKVKENGSLDYTKPTDAMMDPYDGYFYQTPISVLVLVKINTEVAKKHTGGIKITPLSKKSEKELKNSTTLKETDNSLSNILQFSYVDVSTSTSSISYSKNSFIQENNDRFIESFMNVTSGSSGSIASYQSSLNGYTYEYDSYKDKTEDSFYIGCVFEYNTTNIEYIYSINIANEAINDISIGQSLTYIQDFYFRIA